MKKLDKMNRRNFLKAAGVVGAGAFVCRAGAIASANEPNSPKKEPQTEYPQVPRRKLGKTGIDVPILSLGGMFDLSANQIILTSTLKYGIDYWDTAPVYSGGNSEVGIGNFLKRYPQKRRDLFIVTKASGARSVKTIEEALAGSLKAMNTDYIDLYYGVHALLAPQQLTDELRNWAQEAKKRKVIRYFGFSTHKNMAKCLLAAAELGWIDVVMTSYNFRLANDDEMQAAIDACHRAGVAVVAMKVQARGQQIKSEEDSQLAKHFLDRGFTEGQAKIKFVLEDERISSACVTMPNVAILTSNVAASLDKTKLTRADKAVLRKYAAANCNGYCAGCSDICDSALAGTAYVSDIMRYLMYYNSYGEKEMARRLFAQIPNRVRNRLLSSDYRPAELRCRQHMPIAKLMAEAVAKLA